ncbi:SDR family oxidoreductase [Pigmentiphaga soli]|uniref:SDR family oxidoreductase n=1 Tax=Pigmentiphaga soli TaxID=1007095 RepID=A0ABP8H952_9BURK
MDSNSKRLHGKTAVVTGGAQGIGRVYALALAQAGAGVCVSDVAATDDTVEAIRAAGGQAIGVRCDVTDPDSVETMVAATQQRFGRLDVVVNNAALFAQLKMQPFTRIDPAEWDRVMAVNVRGSWQVAKSALPYMAASGGGSIVNISSATVFKGSPFLAHYVASKGAIVALTRSLAREAAEAKVRVNAIAPGLVMSEGVQEHADWQQSSAAIVASRAIRRDSRPEDMVGALLYLASDDSAFVTGQTLVVDGGVVMH